jgi:two-component system response regulator HydG
VSHSIRARILVVDDEKSNLEAMEKLLGFEGYQVVTAMTAAAALQVLKKQSVDLVLSDLRMPGASGLELLRSLKNTYPDVPVVLLTAYGSVNDAVEAMKLGAVDFLSKPIRTEQLLRIVQDSLARKMRSDRGSDGSELIGQCAEVIEIRRTIRLLAPTPAAILIEGESGTGKEVLARLIHRESGRKGRLVTINCGAIPETLLESELFGYERGAFTGAVTAKQGLFEAADGGTLFLDEVGEISQTLQVKLLRVLQDGSYMRLGSTEPRKSNARIISATNANLRKKIAEGSFREDLFYRLNVVYFTVPALRDRGEDVVLLAKEFFARSVEQYGKNELAMPAEFMDAIRGYKWPGNVRELRSAIERMVVLARDGVCVLSDLGIAVIGGVKKRREDGPAAGASVGSHFSFPLGTTLKEIELVVIKQTLEACGGDKAKAAEILGINQRTIYRKLPEMY